MTNPIPNPFRAAEGLTDAALQHHGPGFLRRGGAVGRVLAEIGKGATPEAAAAIGAVFGKGHAAELRLAAEQTIDAGLRELPFFTEPNSVANHPQADLLIRDKGRIARTVQVGVGKVGYLRKKARTSLAEVVVVPTGVKDAIRNQPSARRLTDRVAYKGTTSKVLVEDAVIHDARSILLQALEKDPRVSEWAKWSIATSGGLAAAADSFGTSLLYEVVEKLWNKQPFESGMIDRACVAAGRAGVRSTLQTYLAVDDFLSQARRSFSGRIVGRVAQGVVWGGAVADVVVSTAVEVWRWMKNEISFDELLRRFGVHVTCGVCGALGVGAALALNRGVPGWVQVLLVLGLGYVGWKIGRAFGDEVFKPSWEKARLYM